MAMSDPVLEESELAYLLRTELGPCFQWQDYLSDLRRGRHENIHLPVAFKAGRKYWYRSYDVLEFVAEFRKQYPEAQRGVQFQFIDPAMAAPRFRKTQIRSNFWSVPTKQH